MDYLAKSPSLKDETCSMNNCYNKANSGCIYCKKTFCKEHGEPILVMSPRDVWNLSGLKISDPIKYKKYVADWNRKDGHPCPRYTHVWNAQHDEELKKSLQIIKFPSKRASRQPSINTYREAKRRKITQIVGLVIILIAIVILVLYIFH